MPPQIEGRRHPHEGSQGPVAPRVCRKVSPFGESCLVDVAAGLVGLVAGIVVGPVADRLATNAPRHDASGLYAGDRGVVDQIDEQGRMVVSWDRGFASEIDPVSTPIHKLAA